MKCPKCQYDNPEDMMFCGKCGVKLEKLCPQCSFANPPQFEFCGKCGHNLNFPLEPSPAPKALSFDEKLDRIQRYLPKGLTEKVLAQRDRIEGERKQITVMFCDMEGFTPLVEKLGPEGAYSIMEKVYEILIHKVHDYEGTVNEMTGDGVMALFGAPIALEDAPQRAIRSAYAIHREMARLSGRIKEEGGNIASLKMRIGIHTGPAVVGSLGNDLRVEFKAVGDTVNLASRMEGLADPGATYVTEETFKLTEGLFRYESLGEKEIKGRQEPVKAYRVIGPSTRRTRFDVSAERGLTPFIGRERELELLLDGYERSKDGRGQAFSIVAEAGVGKSRLLYEFRKAITNEDLTFLEGKCLSYNRGVAYHPITDVLKSNFDIGDKDGDRDIRDKVKKGLKVIGADEASTLPYLLELLSVKDSGIDETPMSSEARKDRIREAVKRITLKGSEIRPHIVAVEDLHWIDKSSEEYLKSLLETIAGFRILLIFTYRPEFVHSWGGRSYHNQINLNRLSNRESVAMATHLLSTEEIDRALEDLVLEKTEGIPFFIEEFIKSLKELGIVQKKGRRYHLAEHIQDMTIPSTIQDVIMARVDSLPERAKEVLQTGSVIGREFNYQLIKGLIDITKDELLSQLSAIKESELLYERGIYPESTYVFKHSLTCEVVYDSILTRKRLKLHEKIANAIEDLYRDSLEEHYGILAEHYITSENYEKGAEYSRLAGRRSKRTASFLDAIAYAKKRVSCLERLPRTADVNIKMIDERTTLGLYYMQMEYHPAAKEAIDPIVDLALQSGRKRRLSQIYTILGSYSCMVEEDFSKAFKHLKDALRISQQINDKFSLAAANYWMGFAHACCCEFEKALHHMQKTLQINVEANTLWAISAFKSMISVQIYDRQGKNELAYKITDEAIQIAEESGDIFSKSIAYASHGISCYGKGLLEEAEEHLLKGIDLCERGNIFLWSSIAYYYLGEMYCEIQKYQESLKYYNKAISLFEQMKYSHWIGLCKISFQRSKVINNEKDIELDPLYTYAYENKAKCQDGLVRRHICEILLNIDDRHIRESEDWIKKAIEADRTNGMMFSLGKDYALYAEVHKRKGDQSKGKQSLSKAIQIFEECGAVGWMKKAEEEMQAIS
jgi:class 3 adenylate cyclase/tetratricopeptide (TPR) repeat protein